MGRVRAGRALSCAALLCALSACSAHRFECTRHDGAEVYRVESEHFVAIGELEPAQLQAEVAALERLWLAFCVFFNHVPKSQERTLVVLMRDESPEEFIEGTGGFAIEDVSPFFVTAVQISGGKVVSSANAHELTHILSASWIPTQSRWLAEGLSEYLSDAKFSSQNVVRFGGWQTDDEPLQSLHALWDWDRGRANLPRERTLYSSAWSWIHYFANRDEARLQKLWEALRTTDSPRAAFESIFPPTEWDELHKRVSEYVRQAKFRAWQTTILDTPKVGTPAAIAPWEVHLTRAELFGHVGTGAQVERELEQAVALAPKPTPPRVAFALARSKLRGPELTNALRALPEVDAAALLLGQAEDLPAKERLALLREYATTHPDSTELRLAMARALTDLGDPSAVEAARTASAFAPWLLEPRLLEARALAEAGKCEEATQALDAARSADDKAQGGTWSVRRMRTLLDALCPRSP